MVYIVIIQVLTFLNCPKTLTNCKYPEPLYILSFGELFLQNDNSISKSLEQNRIGWWWVWHFQWINLVCWGIIMLWILGSKPASSLPLSAIFPLLHHHSALKQPILYINSILRIDSVPLKRPSKTIRERSNLHCSAFEMSCRIKWGETFCGLFLNNW